ncbi:MULTISPECIES: hypothetical protein [Pseudomonas]|uniref:Uncharacterized protein n=2 Tax=Pseudomonas TaxID=286 RepID=A0A0W0I1W7_PSEFL|nr:MULTISPECIES: hypothetical protein [Pseudomonas]KTB67031.1 hypothetical protein AO063_21260 [Pseudomonas fluorescens ICMP 11288]RMQ92574.1 hypothetical protein ALP97_00708 [Pseudomonas salomonii]
MTTNRQKAKLIRDAVQKAGASDDEHRAARKVIVGNLIQTKIPIVKICEKHIPVGEKNSTPYKLSAQAEEMFRVITDAIENSKLDDLSDTADDLGLNQDIKLRL